MTYNKATLFILCGHLVLEGKDFKSGDRVEAHGVLDHCPMCTEQAKQMMAKAQMELDMAFDDWSVNEDLN